MPPSEFGMQIHVNGQPTPCADACTLTELLSALHLDPARVVVERNAQIVPVSNYASTRLEEGDRLEILHFVGGG